jgi:DNA polymerase III epsilon subunit family exonuclease
VTRHIVFDTETTGLLLPSTADLKSQPKIIEIGIVEVHAADGHATIFDERSWLIHPGEQISPEITKITGLTNDDLVGKPSFIEVLPELERAFLGVDGLVCHNLPFDLGMLVNELRRCGREHQFPYPPQHLCTVSAYNFIKGHNLKLTDLYKHVIGTELNQTHRALDDARALAQIVIKEGVLS